jgi:hypothetical protein
MSLANPTAGSYVAFVQAAQLKILEQVADGITVGSGYGPFSDVADAALRERVQRRPRWALFSAGTDAAEETGALAIINDEIASMRRSARLSALLGLDAKGHISRSEFTVELQRLLGSRPHSSAFNSTTADFFRGEAAALVCVGAMLNQREGEATFAAAAHHLNSAGEPSAQVTEDDVRHAISSFEKRYGSQLVSKARDAARIERALRAGWAWARRAYPDILDASRLAEVATGSREFAIAYGEGFIAERSFCVTGELFFLHREVAVLEAELARRAA